MPQDDFSPKHPIGISPDLDACLRNIQRWIVQQGPVAAQPSVARGVSAEQGTDNTVGQIPEARVVWDTEGGHNHDASNSRAVPMTGDVTGDNQASIVAQIQAVPVTAPLVGDDQQFLRYNNGTPNYSWETPARPQLAIATKLANYTLTNTDDMILVDATGGAVTITTHASATAHRHVYTVKKIDASANTVTIDGNAAETVDGAATQVLTVQYSSLDIRPDGSNWWIS